MTDQPPRRHQTKRSKKNPIEWHGHRIVTENDLDNVFADTGDVERPHIYMRRLRHGIVLVVLVALLVAAVFVAVGINRGDIRIAALEPDPEPTYTCPAGPFEVQSPSAVTINLYNSTTVSGLAGTVGESLRERAFVVGEIGNRTVNRVGMTAIVVAGPNGYSNAFTVQRQIPGTTFVEDERTDATVDVVVGSGYGALIAEEELDATPAGLVCADPTAESAEAESTSSTPSSTPAAP
ncbi:LytR C-terminal domain-containing protein [Arthrobacter sp. H20]|uniref:LytR C-terminal domain-containing protein n=1 Tax=Arthrobacter sp. H20 TaxID=1267981 RepID=UPI0004BAA08C|nr:LytR C-terminal domain-containing protein [Arthrobacter sp. H20]